MSSVNYQTAAPSGGGIDGTPLIIAVLLAVTMLLLAATHRPGALPATTVSLLTIPALTLIAAPLRWLL